MTLLNDRHKKSSHNLTTKLTSLLSFSEPFQEIVSSKEKRLHQLISEEGIDPSGQIFFQTILSRAQTPKLPPCLTKLSPQAFLLLHNDSLQVSCYFPSCYFPSCYFPSCFCVVVAWILQPHFHAHEITLKTNGI